MFDCHVHRQFSGDSNLNPEIACNTAIQKGLEGITFTDHLDYDYPDFDDTFLIDFDRYSEYMDKLKLEYRDKLRVLKGIEVGIQPHVVEDTQKTVEQYDFDFVIGSIHIVDRTDLHNGDYCKDKTKEESYNGYLNEVLKNIKLFNNYDVIGHIDLIRRYGDYDDKTLELKDFKDVFDAILTRIVHDGKGIEVNTSGYKYNLNSTMPDFEIVKRFKELGGEIICLGSDAHYEKHIAYKFDYAKEMILRAGFEYTAHFEGRKPVFTKIK